MRFSIKCADGLGYYYMHHTHRLKQDQVVQTLAMRETCPSAQLDYKSDRDNLKCLFKKKKQTAF